MIASINGILVHCLQEAAAKTVLRGAETHYDIETMPGTYVQFGCGLCAPLAWRNFDASLTLRIEKGLPLLKPLLVARGFANYPSNVEYGDIVRGLPVAQGSARGIYCSHVLEHLALDECRFALRNVFAYLAPGGIFRLVLPDLEYMISNYLNNEKSDAVLDFIEATDMGERSSSRGVRGLPREIFGRSRHRWMWDYKGLHHELQEIGFSEIRRASFGDSSDRTFLDVETPDRWGNNLGMECRRPAVS